MRLWGVPADDVTSRMGVADMSRLVVAGVMLALALGSGTSRAVAGPDDPTGAFSPAGSFYDFTRGEHVPILLADGRVLILPVFDREAEVWDPETFTFSPAGSFPKDRYGYSVTLLPDGRVLVVGGEGRSRLLASAKLWDPATESFSPAGNLATARRRHKAVLLPDGRVLVVGGCCDERGESLASAEVWDPAKRRFKPAGAVSAPGEDNVVTLLPDGRVLSLEDWASEGARNAAEVWDPAINDFSPAGTTVEPRRWPDAVTLPDGRVLITDSGNATAEIWDPETMTFSPAGRFVERREGYTSTLLPDGRVLFIGGVGGEPGCDDDDTCVPLASAELWDPGTLTFSPAGELSEGRDGHTSTLLPDGRVLVIGSDDWQDPATADVWDPVTSTFSPAGEFDQVRLDYGLVGLPDGRVLITSGWQGGSATVNDALIWDPNLSEPGPPLPAPAVDRNTAEARLLSAVRASIRDACKPLRRNLPKDAVAGLDCPLQDPVVKRVRAYLFREQSDMLDAYFARLATAGLDRDDAHQGRCKPKRPSEGPYHPTQRKDRATYPHRDGCFYDGSGRAHYVSTAPPYVMSEVVGRSGDFDAVRNWAWAGREGDIPGGPTIAG